MKKLTIALASVGLAVTLGFLSSVNAQNAPQPQPPAATQPPATPDQGPMGGMGMKGGMGMMGMMERMGRMMDQCERMMQGGEQQPARPDKPRG